MRELCAKLAVASDKKEWQLLLAELKSAIHEHAEWVKSIAKQSAKPPRKPAA